MKKGIILLIIVSAISNCTAQDRKYAQQIIDTLSSPAFHGRGYVFNGDIKAADFIRSEMKDAGLEPFVPNYYHPFSLDVNTFPGEMEFNINQDYGGQTEAGVGFVPMTDAKGFSGTLKTFYVSNDDLLNDKIFRRIQKSKCKGEVLVIDSFNRKNKELVKRRQAVLKNFKGRALIEINDDLTWGVGRKPANYTGLKVHPDAFNDIAGLKDKPIECEFNIENEYIAKYKTHNVAGMIKGTEQPDSFVFFTAHYDHLGRMGKDVYIPGANDNASGVAMLLDMARYFKKNPPKYSLVFIGFAGEEAGLVGSYHFVKELRGMVDPSKIRFVINMDLMGSGEKGIMAVNGRVFEDEFETLVGINDHKKYLSEVKKRGKAANSDHYFFSESGIPAFFFYLMGDYSYYHEIDDSAENLRLGEYYDKSFLLIRDFLEALQH